MTQAEQDYLKTSPFEGDKTEAQWVKLREFTQHKSSEGDRHGADFGQRAPCATTPLPALSWPEFLLAATESSLEVKWAGLMALRAFTASAAPGRTSHV